jgi:hypothetical protein
MTMEVVVLPESASLELPVKAPWLMLMTPLDSRPGWAVRKGYRQQQQQQQQQQQEEEAQSKRGCRH